MKKRDMTIALFVVTGIILITVGATMAFFSYSGYGTSISTITADSITFHYKEVTGMGHGISISDAVPVSSNEAARSGEKVFDFKITSNTNSTVSIPYTVTAKIRSGSDVVMGEIVDTYLTEVGSSETATALYTSGELLYNDLAPYTIDGVSRQDERVILTTSVPANSTNYSKDYRFRIWIDENANFAAGVCSNTSYITEVACNAAGANWTQKYNDKEFSLTINVYATGTETVSTPTQNLTLGGMILADNPTRKAISNPNTELRTVATTEAQSGLYEMATSNGFGGTGSTTYFFRGDVSNNVVEFAGEIWRVVRINEDGTVRLILDHAIDNVGHNFNRNYNNFSYMYYSNSGEMGDSVRTNAKYAADQWYSNNIGNNETYASKVVTGNYFCEAAVVKGDDSYTTGSATMTLYSSYTPTLSCIKDGNNKQFVVEPVGLITYDEMVLAGNYVGETNEDYYLYKGVNGNNSFAWSTMTPSGHGSPDARVWLVDWSHTFGENYVDWVVYLRPVINLKAEVTATKDETTGHYIVQ